MAQETSPSMKRAGQRYARGMVLSMLLYVVVTMAGVTMVEYIEVPNWAIIVAALAPFVPALMMLRAYMVFVSEVDEFQRRIQSEAVMIAAGVVGFGSFAYGFVEEWANFPHFPLIWVLPALVATWGVALFFLRRKYQ